MNAASWIATGLTVCTAGGLAIALASRRWAERPPKPLSPRTRFWLIYAGHRLVVLVTAVLTVLGAALAVHEATAPEGDTTLAPVGAWASPLIDPSVALAAKLLYVVAVAAAWVWVAGMARLLGRERRRLDAAPAVAIPRQVLPAPDPIRDVFVDDPDFAALARGPQQT